ncbi:MAG: SCP2 sterol-binding domain-containing protein [Pseudomonadota bacterium]
MAFLNDIEAARLAQLLQADPVATAACRHHTATYGLRCDDALVLVTAERGHVSAVRAAGPAQPDITIAGTASQWQGILQGLHGGLHRAWRYKLLDFSGDAVTMMFLWKFMWRMGDALVAVRRGS